MEDTIRGVFGETIANVKFNMPAEQFRISREVSEFTIEIPITIRFNTMPPDLEHLHPVLSNLWGEVIVSDKVGKGHCIGKVLQLDFRQDYRPNSDNTSSIKWTGNLASLAYFEKFRDGDVPKFNLSVRGELYYVLETGREKTPQIKTESRDFWLSSNIEIAKDIWINRLRRINFLENILIEIPLPSSPMSPWDDVWKALVEARDAFEKGGSTGWKHCIVSCRLALEKWQKIEPEDKGPGWVSPSSPDRQARTKSQRLDNIRWHLLQLAHHSAHSHADDWKREDALIVLSTLSALLAERNP